MESTAKSGRLHSLRLGSYAGEDGFRGVTEIRLQRPSAAVCLTRTIPQCDAHRSAIPDLELRLFLNREYRDDFVLRHHLSKINNSGLF